MPVETATYISDLNAANPTAADPKSAGDDHLRLLKSTVKATFPNVAGAMTASHTELNYSVGVTSPIQAQINGISTTVSNNFTSLTASIATKGAHAGQTWTGTHDYSGATSLTVPASTYPAANSNKAASITYVNAAIASVTLIPSPTGHAGKVLGNNGTTAAWEKGGYKLVATITPTVAASIQADGVFTSDYDDYLIVADEIACATSDQKLWFRFGTVGGYSASPHWANGENVGSFAADTEFVVTASNVDMSVHNKGLNLSLEIQNANSATGDKMLRGWVGYRDTAYAYKVTPVAATYFATNGVTRLWLLWSGGGNFAARGQIRIYGKVK